MENKFNILQKETVFQGFFKIIRYTVEHSLYKGGRSKPYSRELFERGDAVAVFLHDPTLDSIILIEQFRIGAIESDNPWVVEMVAGMIEPGESAEAVAMREVEEECGAKAGKLTFITDFYSSVGGCSETTSLFYSQVDASKFEGVHGLDSENEDIRVIKLSTYDFIKKLQDNEFRCASLITAGYWFLANHSKDRS